MMPGPGDGVAWESPPKIGIARPHRRAGAGRSLLSGRQRSGEGKEITRMEAHAVVREGISLVPERRQVFGLMTVHENPVLGAHGRAGAGGQVRQLSDAGCWQSAAPSLDKPPLGRHEISKKSIRARRLLWVKSRRGRGKVHYLPNRAIWVHAPGSGSPFSPASSRPIVGPVRRGR